VVSQRSTQCRGSVRCQERDSLPEPYTWRGQDTQIGEGDGVLTIKDMDDDTCYKLTIHKPCEVGPTSSERGFSPSWEREHVSQVQPELMMRDKRPLF
jgi:hypothetical protein